MTYRQKQNNNRKEEKMGGVVARLPIIRNTAGLSWAMPLLIFLVAGALVASILTVAGIFGTPAGGQGSIGDTSGLSTYIVVFKAMPNANLAEAQNSLTNLVTSSGGFVQSTYTIIDAMAVTVPSKTLTGIYALPGVKSVEQDNSYQVVMYDIDRILEADHVWPADLSAAINDGIQATPNLGTTGYDGTGKIVCMIDSGVDATHPDLQGKVGRWVNFAQLYDGTPADTATHTLADGVVCFDENGHGTHVAGIIAGQGTQQISVAGFDPGPYYGVAPGVTLWSARVCDKKGWTSAARLLEGINWAASQDVKPDVITISIGGGHNDAVDAAIKACYDKGIVVVAGAGNNGASGNGQSSITCPGDCPYAITVGAVSKGEQGVSPQLMMFSSFGSTAVHKPDVCAVGQNVISSKATNVNENNVAFYQAIDDNYAMMSGTSMATPEVAGIAALLLQKDSSLTPEQVKYVINNSAMHPIPPGGSAQLDFEWNPFFGNGIADAYAALTYTGSVPTTSIPPTIATVHFEQSSYTVNDNAGTATFNVIADWVDESKLPAGSPTSFTVGYESQSDTALTGVNVGSASGQLTFTRSAASQPITVSIINTGAPDEAKSFNIKLSTGNNQVALAPSMTTVKILNTHIATVGFERDSYTVLPGHEQVPVIVTVDWHNVAPALRRDVTVTYLAVNGSAVSTVDYTVTGSILTFSKEGSSYPEQMSLPIYVDISNDVNDPFKYFTLQLLDPINASMGSTSQCNVWITGGDKTPPVTTARTSGAKGEEEWYRGDVTFELTAQDPGIGSSGVASTWYQIGSGALQAYTPETSFIVTGDGTNVQFYSVDEASNTETTQSVLVQIDRVAPTINVGYSPAPNANGWNNGPVTVTFTAADGQSGLYTASTYSKTFTAECSGQIVTWSATDMAGNTATATATINIDMTPPTIVGSRSPIANLFGWNNEPVTVSFDCSDALSGVDYCVNDPTTLSGEGVDQSVTGTVYDRAGNTASAMVGDIDIDLTLPTITAEYPAANAFKWYKEDVSVHYVVDDALSGIDPSTVPADYTFTVEAAGQSKSATVSDKAGNTKTASVTGINLDKTAPKNLLVSVPLVPIALGTPVTANCSYEDLSGIQSVRWYWEDGTSSDVITSTLSPLPSPLTCTHTYPATGIYTITVSMATDLAGNVADNLSAVDYIVVYDPNGGFVTGGGWFNSPAGVDALSPDWSGKANFGFNCKYKKGSAPTGSTEFQADKLKFKSTSFEWLMISGQKAVLKGTGTVNDAGTYSFLISVWDSSPDKFRMKICDSSGVLVYDNQPGAADYDAAAMPLGGGSIVVHK